jgi:hypothetical protein
MCQLGSHQWDGCKCTECGKTRDKDHDWSMNDCNRCFKCGKTRADSHNWVGCTCEVCGKLRDEAHDWKGCKCKKCGKVRDQEHDWSKDCERCANCGQTREVGHRWSDDKKYCLSCGIQHPYCKFKKLRLDGNNIYQICEECGREQLWSPKIEASKTPGCKIFIPDYSRLKLDESYIQKKDRAIQIPEDTIVLPFDNWMCPVCGNHFSDCGSSGAISKFICVPKGGAPTGGYFWWKIVQHCNRNYLISNRGNY